MPQDFELLSMTELRNRPGEILDRVADAGEAFIIERNGSRKACLVPLSVFFPDVPPARIGEEIEELEKHEEISKQLQVLLNLFGKAKANDSADFSANPEFLAAVNKIRELDSSVVDGLLGHADDKDYHWKTKEDLEALWQGCNSAMRLQTSHVEKVMMRISQLYQDRADLFDTGSKAVKDHNDLMQRIINQRG